MKFSSFFVSLSGFVATTLLLPPPALATDVISLQRPVGESLKPSWIYWSFDNGKIREATPNPAKDSSGNGFEGFLLPSENGTWPEYVEGKFGTAIHLQGSNPTEYDARVSWNIQDSLTQSEVQFDNSGQSFTAGAWVKFNEIRSGENQTFVVFERGHTAGENDAWNLSIIKAPNEKWRLRVLLPGLYRDAANESISLSDGEWHHVAFSFQADDAGGMLTFWFDGAPQQEVMSVEAAASPMGDGEKCSIFTVGERNPHYHISDSDASVDDAFVTSGIYTFEN